MRGVPIAFDIATYFAIAVGTLRHQGYEKFDIALVAIGYRDFSTRDKTYGDDVKDWRLMNLVWRLATLIPGVQNIYLARADRIPAAKPRFPAEYGISQAFFPYSAAELIEACQRGANIHIFGASAFARNWAKQALQGTGSIVMTIRVNDFDPARDTPLDLWYALYRHLTAKGNRVFVIPDQFDLLSTQRFKKYDWNVLEAAAMDLDLRLALHQEAATSILWGGGSAYLAAYSTASFLMFGVLNRHSNLSNETFFAKVGLPFGVQPPYLLPNQIYDWADGQALTKEYLISATEKYLAGI